MRRTHEEPTEYTIDVLVEIPRGSRNKYEFDRRRGVIKLDRVLYSSVHYPTDYGFIPQTLSPDGDELDVLVMVEEPTFPGCLVVARPIGVLIMHELTRPTRPLFLALWNAHFKVLQAYGRWRHPEWSVAFRDVPFLLARTRWVEDLVRALEANRFSQIALEPGRDGQHCPHLALVDCQVDLVVAGGISHQGEVTGVHERRDQLTAFGAAILIVDEQANVADVEIQGVTEDQQDERRHEQQDHQRPPIA